MLIAQVIWNPIMEAFFFLHAANYLLFWSGTVLKIAVFMLRCSCFDLRKGYQLVYKKMHLGSDHKPPWQRLTPLTLFWVFCKSDYLYTRNALFLIQAHMIDHSLLFIQKNKGKQTLYEQDQWANGVRGEKFWANGLQFHLCLLTLLVLQLTKP